jgi:hypothetical protein
MAPAAFSRFGQCAVERGLGLGREARPSALGIHAAQLPLQPKGRLQRLDIAFR